MQTNSGKLWVVTSLALAASACGYNEIINRDEDVQAAWSEVQNQYQRRADLIPNVVNAVKGAAAFEQKTLTAVVEARAKVAGLKIDSTTIDDPEKLRQFEAAQQQLSGSLARLLVVSESYPDLKASQAFRDLVVELEGTENRIAVARGRYVASVAEYNKVALRFPSMIGAKMRGKSERPNLQAPESVAKAPEVKF